MNTIETVPCDTDQARKDLEAFVTDNPQLERLEGLLAQFNIFEAIGAVRHEVRHSDFLAYLLNPQENHGLGDAFFKRLLRNAMTPPNAIDLPVTLVEIDAWDLSGATVQREWQRIDVFLRDETHQFSVIIENKIDTGEHDDQLSRYYERVRLEYPNDRILALYLTKDGDEPTDDRYSPIGYEWVCEAVEHLAESHAPVLNPDVRTLMTHYAQMLRRHIMSDTEIARLCGEIYQKHRTALDLIYEHRPDEQPSMTQFLQAMIEQTDGLRLGGTHKGRYIGFGLAGLHQRTLYFVFDNARDSVTLRMQTATNLENKDISERIFEYAARHQPPFNLERKAPRTAKSTEVVCNNIFRRTFLEASDYEKLSRDGRQDKVLRHWEHFLRHDLPSISRSLSEADWIDYLKSQT